MEKLLKIKYISLNSKNEFKSIDENYNYHLIIIDTNEKITIFMEYLDFVFEQIKKQNKIYCSLDFEFNSKKIALFQLCFEIYGYDRFIFFVYPPMFTENEKNKFIKILLDIRITKILHGSDSLDIPYLFNDFLIEDKLKKIFLMNFVDTKFLCEYDNLINQDTTKCKIYELLLKKNIITNEKLNELMKNDDKMGPIYEIFIDIKNLSEELILYSLYDVVFLKKLVESFSNVELIKEITQFTINQKNNLLTSQTEIIETITKLNNNFFKLPHKILRLNDLYLIFFEKMDNQWTQLSKINYFKKTVEIIVKYCFYYNISRRYHYYEKSNVKNTMIVKEMRISRNKYPIIFEIFNNLNKTCQNFVNTEIKIFL